MLTEAITNYPVVCEHLLPSRPGSLLASGGSSLGWSGGAAVGAKLAAPDRTMVSLVGDGSYLFGVPGLGAVDGAPVRRAVAHRDLRQPGLGRAGDVRAHGPPVRGDRGRGRRDRLRPGGGPAGGRRRGRRRLRGHRVGGGAAPGRPRPGARRGAPRPVRRDQRPCAFGRAAAARTSPPGPGRSRAERGILDAPARQQGRLHHRRRERHRPGHRPAVRGRGGPRSSGRAPRRAAGRRR